MSNNFVFDEYNITTTLTELSVYMRVMNNVSYQCYENILQLRDINLPFKKNHIYDIICNCFNKKENYDVIFTIKNNSLLLAFNILFEGIFESNFNLILPEKKLSEENNLTLNINKIEIEYKKEVENLKKEIEKMKTEYEKKLEEFNLIFECLTCSKIHDCNYDKKIEHLSLDASNGLANKLISSIGDFIKLKTLHIQGNLFSSFKFRHPLLKKIIFLNCDSFNSFQGIENFTNLEEIEIQTSFNAMDFNVQQQTYLSNVKNLKKIILKSINRPDFKSLIVDFGKKYNIDIEIN